MGRRAKDVIKVTLEIESRDYQHLCVLATNANKSTNEYLATIVASLKPLPPEPLPLLTPPKEEPKTEEHGKRKK